MLRLRVTLEKFVLMNPLYLQQFLLKTEALYLMRGRIVYPTICLKDKEYLGEQRRPFLMRKDEYVVERMFVLSLLYFS